MLDIWLVYWIPVSKGMEDAMSTPRIPPEDCPCGKAQTCYECTHPPSERDKVLDVIWRYSTEALINELLKRDGIKEYALNPADGRRCEVWFAEWEGAFPRFIMINALRQAGEP